AVGRLHLEHAVANLQHGDIERAATEVVDRDRLRRFLLVEAIGQRGGRRLVDDAQDLEAGDAAGILGRLALRVIEIGRHRDHGLRDGLAEVSLRRLLHLLQDESGYLGRRVLFAVRFDPGVAVGALYDVKGYELPVALDRGIVEAAADQPLDREKRVA